MEHDVVVAHLVAVGGPHDSRVVPVAHLKLSKLFLFQLFIISGIVKISSDFKTFDRSKI